MSRRYTDVHFDWGNESERWEPQSPSEWMQRDPFRETEMPIPESREQDQAAVFGAWRHLPAPLRRQVWREREIAASVYRLSRELEWGQIPGIRSMGVGKRQEGSQRRLVGIVTFESELPVDASVLYEHYPIPQSLRQVPSSVYEFAEDVNVPLHIEYAPAPSRFQIGIVQPDQFISASDGLPMPVAVPTLQAGDIVAGENPTGFRTPGTLTTIVSRQSDDWPLLLSAAHVLGEPGWKVVANVPVPTEVGRVVETHDGLDAAIAEFKEPWIVDYRLKAINVVPAAPVMPFADMPVQFVGGASGHQQGWISVVNSIPVGGASIGIIPHFCAAIHSQPGDSGALLVSSHGRASPIPPAFAGTMHPQYVETMTCAMLGALVAGPSGVVSQQTRPQTYFTPILSILNHFRLQAWVRPIP